jgi:short subunit dehydrogenase-like uncharacterized protein
MTVGGGRTGGGDKMTERKNDPERNYEIVVWGATGFVGELICEYLIRAHGDVRWAMAGRNRNKLEALREKLGAQARDIPILVADASSPDSLSDMVRSTRVVLSTVGPYAKYGSALVAACAKHGTDYCDLAGETQWIRRMIDAHQSEAEASGARIVPCSGFDSIPSDLGVLFLQNEARSRSGTPCKSVKMRVKAFKGTASGGTVASMLNLFEEARADKEVARILKDPYALNPEGLRSGPRQPSGMNVAYDEEAKAWAAPFIMAAINTRVVQRSNALSDYSYGKDFLYEEMMLTGSGPLGAVKAAGVALGLGGFALAATVETLRGLMNRLFLPQPGEGPDEHTRETGFYDLRFFATTATGESIQTRVTGDRDPGYGSTSKMIGEVAICLARDVAAEDVPGGFWTPATAMGTRLIERLEADAGLTFTVVE